MQAYLIKSLQEQIKPFTPSSYAGLINQITTFQLSLMNQCPIIPYFIRWAW